MFIAIRDKVAVIILLYWDPRIYESYHVPPIETAKTWVIEWLML